MAKLTKKQAEEFIKKFDFKGLSEAYRESEISWSENEWREFIESIRKQEQERIKDLIVKEINIARSENEKTSRLTSLWNRINKSL